MLPELPKANYDVWVRGYGLVDSPKVKAAPGKVLNLNAVVAPNAAAAAEYYPAQYWYSMLQIPDKSLFPGTGDPAATACPTNVKSQGQWLVDHQDARLQLLPPARQQADAHDLAGARRVQDPPTTPGRTACRSGPPPRSWSATSASSTRSCALKNFADWTDRIAAGELPKTKPQRPQGVERNIVVTMWDWGDAKTYLHDEIATDKRNPTVNAWGKIYSATEDSTDNLPILDPKTNTVTYLKMTPRDPKTPAGSFIQSGNFPRLPSPYWGDEKIWNSQTSVHNPMLDQDGRVWLTARIRAPQTPAFCRKGSDHPSAKLFPMDNAGRQAAVYDPKTEKLTLRRPLLHHPPPGLRGGRQQHAVVLGRRRARAGGRLAQHQEIPGDRRRRGLAGLDARSSSTPTATASATKAMSSRTSRSIRPRTSASSPASTASATTRTTAPSGARCWPMPGGVVHVIPGDNPPATTLSEYYEVPFNEPQRRGQRLRSARLRHRPQGRGLDPARERPHGELRPQEVQGPAQRPDRAPAGIARKAGRSISSPARSSRASNEPGAVQSSYYTWVDQFDTLGLGKNVPMATGNMSDSLEALVDGKFVTLRVPYPMGFHAKGLDGRIDDRDHAAGRAAACGRPMRAARPTTSKAARARPARW